MICKLFIRHCLLMKSMRHDRQIYTCKHNIICNCFYGTCRQFTLNLSSLSLKTNQRMECNDGLSCLQSFTLQISGGYIYMYVIVTQVLCLICMHDNLRQVWIYQAMHECCVATNNCDLICKNLEQSHKLKYSV